MFYDEKIAKAKTPSELLHLIYQEMEAFSNGPGDFSIHHKALMGAVGTALGIRGRNLDQNLSDVPSDLAGLINWCINSEKIMTGAWRKQTERNLTVEEQKLFYQIQIDIRSNPEKYREAGKWLNDYCSIKSFWRRKEDLLNHFVESKRIYEKQAENCPPSEGDRHNKLKASVNKKDQEIECLQQMIKWGIYVSLKYAVQEWCHNGKMSGELALKWYQENLPYYNQYIGCGVTNYWLFHDALSILLLTTTKPVTNIMRIERARKICLLAWLITDPDADTYGLGLTRFEGWKWEPCHLDENGNGDSRSNFLEFGYEHGWTNCIQAAWTKIKAEKETETKQDQKAEINEAGKQQFLIESIHRAYEAVEKLAEADLDLDNLTEKEMTYADAVVIEYLIKRYGEQDDAAGNWPRDWHECPEAFELWKKKIRELRTNEALTGIEEIEDMVKKEGNSGKADIGNQSENDEIENILETDIAKEIAKVLGTEKKKRIQIVHESTYNEGGHMGGTLTLMKKMGILQHKRPYYWMNPEFYKRLGICPDKDGQ